MSSQPDNWNEKKNQLNENIALCRKHKQEIKLYCKALKTDLKAGLLSSEDYSKAKDEYLKGKSLDEWIQLYNNRIADYKRLIRKKTGAASTKKLKLVTSDTRMRWLANSLLSKMLDLPKR